jgi:hypothetical protein
MDKDTKLKEAKQKRELLKKQKEQKEDSRELFRKYFLKLSKKLTLEAYLEEVLWLHLKSIKCDSSEKFEQGIKHFGYKI